MPPYDGSLLFLLPWYSGGISAFCGKLYFGRKTLFGLVKANAFREQRRKG